MRQSIHPRRAVRMGSAATIALAAALLAAPAGAQTASESAEDAAGQDGADQPASATDIVVQAEIGYRNRSEETEPVLVYDEGYFQRFEPLTAGDALKRVPSVTFLSDVIESDGARLRGLDPGYTQILLNGEKVPGSNADRSFFLDRVPAELIRQVEIVRSSSARRTGDAVAGTINIVLRDGFKLDGGYVRGGALLFDDGEVKPAGGLFWGGAVGPGRGLIGINVQGRYNPKIKSSLRYGDSPENNPDFAAEDFDNREDQRDTRDGTDYAVNASWGIDTGGTAFELSGNYVRTKRTEDERSYEYDDPTATTGPVGTPGGNLLTDNANVNRIEQDSWSVAARLAHGWLGGRTKLRATFARFDDASDETEYEVDFDRSVPRFTGDLTRLRSRDDETSVGIEHRFDLGAALGGDAGFAVGGFWQDKARRLDLSDNRVRYNLPADTGVGYDQFTRNPTEFLTAFDPLESVTGGRTRIDEERRDLYALIEGKAGAVSYEAGLRWEDTRADTTDPVGAVVVATGYDVLLPSASIKWELGGGRVTASAARTLRRPRFDYLAPVVLEAEFGDNDLRGNPLLRPETAWGADLGYEHRIGRTGVAGVNVFYRRITNLTELVNTGEEGSEGPGTVILEPRNVGRGKAWGIEFDLSASLGALGLPDTGVFGNLGLIDSEVDDLFGTRRFNGQSKYVFNVGAIQNLRGPGIAFGATYRKQGPAFDRLVGEEVRTTYGGDLELFIEKRFGDRFTIRAVGSNLLDGTKDEAFNKFDTIADQTARDFDEYELESERAGPVFQLIARVAF